MNQLLQWSFWFDARPLPFNSNFLWIIVGVFAGAIIFAIISSRLRKQKTGPLHWQIWSKLLHLSLSFGLVGLLLVFFKEERIIYLGMRVWLILWVLICLVWLGFV